MSRHRRYVRQDDFEPEQREPLGEGSDDAAVDERPSKSARKRAAHAAQALGERLIELKDTDLVRLALPEPLLDAVRQARRIKARGGLARQKQYIGKLMRDLDTDAIELALAELR